MTELNSNLKSNQPNFINNPSSCRKGHICFDGGHETMNLGKVGFITNQEYDIYIRPDSADPRSR